MTTLKYNLVSVGDDDANLTLFVRGEMYIASSTHANWLKIVTGVLSGDENVVDLFDVSKTVSAKFETLSGRATVSNGRLYFDGDEMHNALADEVVRFLDEGVDDWKPLIAFLEKVQQNPQEHSRNQLFEWLTRRAFTITDAGDIIGYKSVKSDGAGTYTSISSGTAIVNGEVKTGRIPQKVGDVVTMPRADVAFDPSQGCSTGLHVANWDYATTWTSHDAVLAVAVNPRDVVSVPTDCDFQKVRVCRYQVMEVVDHVKEDVVYSFLGEDYDDSDEYDDDYDYDDDELYCDYCGDFGHEEDGCHEKAEDEAYEVASKEKDAAAAAEQDEIDDLNRLASDYSAANPSIAGTTTSANPVSFFKTIWDNLPPKNV